MRRRQEPLRLDRRFGESLVRLTRIRDVLDQVDGDDSDRVRFSVLTRSNSKTGYYIPHLEQYEDKPFGQEDAYELSYQELFAAFPLLYIQNELFRTPDGELEIDWLTRKHYGQADMWTHDASMGTPPTADVSLVDLCRAATTDDRMEVFTIAFAAGTDAERVMNDCADTGASGTYIAVQNIGNDTANSNVTDGGLAEAFSDILAAIENLRLTQ